MSLSQSLSNALSGLTAASRMAEVVSANLANALTDGYGRRAVALSARTTGTQGAGVRIDGIARIVDRGVLADRRAAGAALSGRSLTTEALVRVETAIGAAGSDDSLAARLAALELALTAAGADPASDIALGRVKDRLGGLAAGLNDAAAAIQAERLAADQRIAGDIDLLNRSLAALEGLNGDIATATRSGHDASALMDQRQQVVDRIAAIVPVREIDRGAGQVALVTTGGEILIDGPARRYGFAGVGTMTADMSLESGALSGLLRDGQPVDAAQGIGLLGGGTLGAAMTLRDQTLPAQAAALDTIAADLIDRLAGADPTLAPGAPGLLTDAGQPRDPLTTTGLAGRIALNAAIDPARGGSLSALRDGLGATLAGPVGDSRQIDAWLSALQAGSGAHDRIAALTGGIGNDRLLAEEAETRASARWSALRETELAGGVDSDHELQMLLRIEQAYAANARVMSVIDGLMDTLLEI